MHDLEFLPNITYRLKNKNDMLFSGKLIDRKYGLGKALSGKDGNGERCHLPLKSISNPEFGWELI